MDERLHKIMSEMEDVHASDLHISGGMRPKYRIAGEICQAPGSVPLGVDEVEKMVHSLVNDTQWSRLEEEKELDCSVGIKGRGRYRVNVSYQRGSLALAIRRLPHDTPGFNELGLPVRVMEHLSEKDSGMVLVTGPTGSGKSTTLAAMVDYINRKFCKHIVCIEDPIEYLHSHQKSIVHQREIGQDTHGFEAALTHVLRQDPDVVQIGEMRNLETIQTMLNVAETGHLALSTLHTSTAVTTINRIVDVFPSDQQQQVRIQLSFELQAVIAQQLIPKANEEALVLAYEILIATPAIRNLIREGKAEQIYSHLQMGSEMGMRTMNESLVDLYRRGAITELAARSKSTDNKEFTRLLRGE